MMRRNLALVLALTLAAPAAFAKEPRRKRLDQMSTTKDRWNELMNSENLDDDKPKREVIRVPARAAVAAKPAAARPTRVAPRGPASVAPVRVQQPGSAFPVAAISFDEYLADNGRNPALSKAIPDKQSAFVETRGPAVISMPGAEEPPAANSATSQQGTLGANPTALQNAAAAAAAAGLIPGAGGFSQPAGQQQQQQQQQQNSGGPLR